MYRKFCTDAQRVVDKINTGTPYPTKAGLVTGGSKEVGLEVGLNLARNFPSNSKVFLTTKEKDVSKMRDELAAKYDRTVTERIKFVHFDISDNKSIINLYQVVKQEAVILDCLVNNAQKYLLPSQDNEELFKAQCEETMSVNYWGMKKVFKIFSPMINRNGRMVLCSSHLGHLSNLDGREPAASSLRKRFADKNLTEEKLDALVNEFMRHVAAGGAQWVEHGWPSCPYTVSKVAVNAYARILQSKMFSIHEQKDLVVNAVHHGCFHKDMNAGNGFSHTEAGEFVAGMALLPESTHMQGKIVWREYMVVDDGSFGDDNKKSKAITKFYEMEKHQENIHDINNGICLTG